MSQILDYILHIAYYHRHRDPPPTIQSLILTLTHIHVQYSTLVWTLLTYKKTHKIKKIKNSYTNFHRYRDPRTTNFLKAFFIVPSSLTFLPFLPSLHTLPFFFPTLFLVSYSKPLLSLPFRSFSRSQYREP